MAHVLMLPGFGGGADQPVLVQLEAALAQLGLSATRAVLPPGRPLPGLAREVDAARAFRRSDPDLVAYAGRSFGGRVLARLALVEPPRALVLLGFPVRGAGGKRRPEDEAVLVALRCPTLIVQGAADPLGPLRTLRRLVRQNPRIALEVIPDATHSFGRAQTRALSAAAAWLEERLREPAP